MSTNGHVLGICRGDSMDDEVIRLSRAMAQSGGREVALLAAEESPRDLARIASAAGLSEAAVLEKIEADLAGRIGSRCGGFPPGERPDIAIRFGKPFVEIIRAAHDRQARLLIKAADERGRKGPFGSTDQHLLRKCPCPVWLARGGGEASPRTVLVAIDADTAAAVQPDTQAALNDEILSAAARLARAFPVRLILLHAWDAVGETLVRRWSGGEDQVQAYIAQAESQQRDNLETLHKTARRHLTESGASAMAVETRLKRGLPKDVIPAEVLRSGADLLLIGTVGRAGVTGFLIGNTAEDVLNTVRCSVLAIKPPGFESPIR